MLLVGGYTKRQVRLSAFVDEYAQLLTKNTNSQSQLSSFIKFTVSKSNIECDSVIFVRSHPESLLGRIRYT